MDTGLSNYLTEGKTIQVLIKLLCFLHIYTAQVCLWLTAMLSSLTLSPLVVTCRLLITFANSLDPDQARQNVRPDLDPNYLTLMVFLKIFLKKLILQNKNPQTTTKKKHAKLCSMQRVNCMKVGWAYGGANLNLSLADWCLMFWIYSCPLWFNLWFTLALAVSVWSVCHKLSIFFHRRDLISFTHFSVIFHSPSLGASL